MKRDQVGLGSGRDALLARDHSGRLRQLMMETLDGEDQACKAFGGACTREHFFGKYPETAALVATMSDEEVGALDCGGHDPHKICAAYHAAVRTAGVPTVILAKTTKGYGLGLESGESENPAHRCKKLDKASVQRFRDRFQVPLDDALLEEAVAARGCRFA